MVSKNALFFELPKLQRNSVIMAVKFILKGDINLMQLLFWILFR